MNVFSCLIILLLIVSCATEKPKFVAKVVCSNQALKYLVNPRNKDKSLRPHPALIQAMAKTTRDMQLCYEDFKNRTGEEEFNTCLVVGVNDSGVMDFYNFSSQEIRLDEKFLSCAKAITHSLPYSQYGNNYILIQAYQFYIGEI